MKKAWEHTRFGRETRRVAAALLLVASALLLAQACGQSGKSTGPSGNSSVAVGLKRVGAALPNNCTGSITATGPVTRTAPVDANGQATLGGLPPGTYLFSALLDCPPNGLFAGQSPPTQIIEGFNNVLIEIITTPIDVGVQCDANQLTPGQSTTCHCKGTLVTGGTPTFGWSGAPSGSSSKDPTFTFPQPGTFNISCLVSNGPNSRQSPSVAVVVSAPTGPTGPTIINVTHINNDVQCCPESINVTISGIGTLMNLAPGETRPQQVPPGTYTLTATCGAAPSPQTVTVNAGQTVGVTFTSTCDGG